jgi:two-component system response regulator HydG
MAATIGDAIVFAPFDDIIVVLVGESGVGKSLIAQIIHLNSLRAGGPFRDGTLVRMSEGTVESELFGHARGAFTDARRDRAGLCLGAQHGTLFLDEFGHASQAVQRQLLALLERRAVRRLGDDREIPVNVRYLIGTNIHPRTQVERGARRRASSGADDARRGLRGFSNSGRASSGH